MYNWQNQSNNTFVGPSQRDRIIAEKNQYTEMINSSVTYVNGQMYIKPGYEKTYNDAVMGAQDAANRLALLDSQLQQQQQMQFQRQQQLSQPVVPPIPPVGTHTQTGPSYNTRMANAMTQNQSRNYSFTPAPMTMQQQQQIIQPKQPKVEKPKEKIFINGALPYLNYLVDGNHIANEISVADRENTFMYEIKIKSKEVLEWTDDDEIVSAEDVNIADIEEYQPGSIITNGFLLYGNINRNVVDTLHRTLFFNVFGNMYSTGRKVSSEMGQDVATKNLRSPRTGKSGVIAYKEGKLYAMPMIIVDDLIGLTETYYRISRDSHNKLFTKIMMLDTQYPVILLGQYDPQYGNFAKFMAMRVDEEIGCVNLRTTKSSAIVNWLF